MPTPAPPEEPLDAVVPHGGGAIAARWRRWVTWPNLLLLALAVWVAPRLLPHLGALVGVRSGQSVQPALEVVTRGGRVLTMDSLRGRVVLINVWATWCAPCRVEMPALQQIADAYASGDVVVLGLSVDQGPASAVDAFLAERAISYPVAIVGGDVLAALGGVDAYPTSFLLDRRGVVQHKVVGPIGPWTLRPALWRLRRTIAPARPVRDSA